MVWIHAFQNQFPEKYMLCNGNCHNRSEQKYQIFWNHMNFLLVLLGLMRFSWIFLGTSYCTCHHLEIIGKCVLEIGEWVLCFHALLWLLCVDIYCPCEWLDRGIFYYYQLWLFLHIVMNYATVEREQCAMRLRTHVHGSDSNQGSDCIAIFVS